MHMIDSETRRFGRLLHYAGLLLTVVSVAMFYSFVHVPMTQATADVMVRIEEVLLSAENAPLIREQHSKVLDTLQDVTAQIAEVQRRVPREADAGGFLKEVTKVANAERLTIKDFQPEKPMVGNGFAQMRVTLKGQGSFASICSFFDQLSRLTRLSKVQDLTLSAGEHASDHPMTATLVIFFALQEAAAKSAQEGRSG